jgi:hypothetical protein
MKTVIVTLVAAFLFTVVVSLYQADTIEQQRHTIRQLQGLERGPHDTPSLPKYVPDADERSI